jgi:hypothetical protein
VVGYLDRGWRGALHFVFVKLLSYPVCMLQSGRVQTYALFVVVGVLAFLRVLRRAVTYGPALTQHRSFTPLAGLLVLLFLPSRTRT